MRRVLLCTVTATTLAALAPAVPSSAASTVEDGGRTLRYGTAQQAGLLPQYVAQLEQVAADGMNVQANGHPMYPGAVVLAAHDGVIVSHRAMGYGLRYADDAGTELPAAQWLPMRSDTIFDLASISKLFTSIVAMQQVEAGRIDLDETVAHYLPGFGEHGKDVITVRQLLTHTSGLRPDISFFNYPTYEQKIAALYADTPQAAPGSAYIYSDVNLIALALVAERVSGRPLDVLVRDGITRPLGMTDTGYHPPADQRYRVAAEEYEHVPPAQVERGLVWGEVHDENAWAFGGVAGHAGVFSTARDLAVLCQAILNGGSYGHARILRRDTVTAMLTNENQGFPGNSHGLGFELAQPFYMGALSTPYTAGHTGYTGTTLVIDPTTRSFVLLLTNRVHPSRNWGSINPAREGVANALARAVPVRPVRGHTAWYGGMNGVANGPVTATLTVPAAVTGPGQLSFALWYATEPGFDTLTLEGSADGQTWTPVPFRLDGAATNGTVSGYGGGRWHAATADLAGTAQLRWRYAVDRLHVGRGVYVDAIRVTDRGRTVFDDSRPGDAAAVLLTGWAASPD
jgi:CubicO group peptidase (beta-lactamase class C family)